MTFKLSSLTEIEIFNKKCVIYQVCGVDLSRPIVNMRDIDIPSEKIMTLKKINKKLVLWW